MYMCKKSLKMIIALLLVCVLLFSLTACATTLKGTYTIKDGLVAQSFTFMEDNHVEMSAFGIDLDGSYVIEDGQIIITYSLLGLKQNWSGRFVKDGDSIFIEGTEFVKEK